MDGKSSLAYIYFYTLGKRENTKVQMVQNLLRPKSTITKNASNKYGLQNYI